MRASTHPQKCLNRALTEIQNFSSSVYDEVIRAHKIKHPDQWSDPDLSPSGWLACDSSQSDFDDSVVTFVHELTHQIRDDNKRCIYLAVSKKYSCFDLPDSLPLRSYGKQETFPTKNPDALRGLGIIQKIYLTDTDQPLFMLLDEWNAYILSNQNYLDRYKNYGSKRMFDADGKRPGVFLPLFFKISMSYLERLKKDQPRIYEETIYKNQTNRASLSALINGTKKTYGEWVAYLKEQGHPEKDWERSLFHNALEIQKSLNL